MRTVTALVSPDKVCVDGVSCHVSDLHPFSYAVNNPVDDEIPVFGDDKMYIMVSDSEDGQPFGWFWPGQLKQRY